jgi:acetyl esterase/lipase
VSEGAAENPVRSDVLIFMGRIRGGVRLAAAGRDDVDVTLRVAPEGTHVFQLYFGALDEADEALDEVARFFRRHLG